MLFNRVLLFCRDGIILEVFGDVVFYLYIKFFGIWGLMMFC